jgi:beta-galactosidase
MISRSILGWFFVISATVTVHAQSSHSNFDFGWKFSLGHAADPEKDFNYGTRNLFSKAGAATGTAAQPNFNDSAWQTVQIPHDWAVALPFVNSTDANVKGHGYKPLGRQYPETSIGWYRKHFTVSPADSGRRFNIQFDGIYRDAQVWINGFYLGNHKSGYLGVTYDLTDFLNYRKENVIVVRADATQQEGWYYEGAGIYRHVWLSSHSPVHIPIDGIFTHASLTADQALLTVETTLLHEGNKEGSYELVSFLTTREGEPKGKPVSQQISARPGQQIQTTQQIAVEKPILWELTHPYLYRVIVQLRQGGQVIEEKKLRFGFRSIEVKENGVFLNGKHIKILGTNNHQDHAGVGLALPDYLQYYRISLLKRMGSNAYRTSHHAPTPELLDACDSLGMLVMDEPRLLNSGSEYLQQFEQLVKRDRSRTSVFMWSIGNEETVIQTQPTGKKIAQTFIEKLKQLDPTRTCTYAANVGNVINGINEVIPVRGFNYHHTSVAAYHNKYPGQPIIGTEMGSTVSTRGEWVKDADKGYLPDQDISYPSWASTAEAWWKLAAPNDYWLGGFIWTGFDYRGEPTPFQWPNISSHFGIMDVCGFPKNIYYYYQSWWTNEDVLHISPHWNHRNETGKPAKEIDVWVNSNADSVELFLNNKSLGIKTMPRNSHLQWKVNFEPGKLEAVAYKQKRKFVSKVETTGAPAAIVVTTEKKSLLADGSDATVMNMTVVDQEGREVPDADQLLSFEIEGDARIVGVGNGDPSSHEADQCIEGNWQRRLFNGKCQVIVQSGQKAGTIRLKAKATGLREGSMALMATVPQ